MERHWRALICALALLGLALRAPYLERPFFHTDEYRTLHWSLLVSEGDLFLNEAPTDKPPLLYLLLGAAFRLFGPSIRLAVGIDLAISLASIVVIGLLGRRLYDDAVTGALAAWFASVALLHILFSTSLFLDPLMILLGLSAWLAAGLGRPLASGLLCGLAFATKQTGILFLPLVLATLACARPASVASSPDERTLMTKLDFRSRWPAHPVWRCIAGTALVVAVVVMWSLGARTGTLNFLYLQLANEGHTGLQDVVVNLSAGSDDMGARARGWWQLASRLVSGPITTGFGVLGIAGMILLGSTRRWRDEHRTVDVLVIVAIAVFVGLHVVVRFRLIDRYLLPLVPLLALALGRVCAALLNVASSSDTRAAVRIAAGGVVAAMLVGPLLTYGRAAELAIVDGRKLGIFYAARPELHGALLRLASELREQDEVLCDPFTCPAAAFILGTGRARELGEDQLRRLTEQDAALLRTRRTLIVWSSMIPIADLRTRLERAHIMLVPIESHRSGLLVYQLGSS